MRKSSQLLIEAGLIPRGALHQMVRCRTLSQSDIENVGKSSNMLTTREGIDSFVERLGDLLDEEMDEVAEDVMGVDISAADAVRSPDRVISLGNSLRAQTDIPSARTPGGWVVRHTPKILTLLSEPDPFVINDLGGKEWVNKSNVSEVGDLTFWTIRTDHFALVAP